MGRDQVKQWLSKYQRAWRAPGTEALAGVFTDDAVYSLGPYHEPVVGLAAIGRMWDAERASPDEVFRLAVEIIAVDGDTAVVRADVRYGDPVTQEYLDLWIIRFAEDERCRSFEEWPFWPERAITPPTP